MNKFLLMHKDREVAIVSIERDVSDNRYLHINRILNSNEIPHGVKSATEKEIDSMMTNWNNSRCTPLGRPNYEKILKELNAKTTSEIIPHAFMCSLTDC